MMIKIQTVAYGMWCNPYFQDRALVHYISYQELVKLQPISVDLDDSNFCEAFSGHS